MSFVANYTFGAAGASGGKQTTSSSTSANTKTFHGDQDFYQDDDEDGDSYDEDEEDPNDAEFVINTTSCGNVAAINVVQQPPGSGTASKQNPDVNASMVLIPKRQPSLKERKGINRHEGCRSAARELNFPSTHGC